MSLIKVLESERGVCSNFSDIFFGMTWYLLIVVVGVVEMSMRLMLLLMVLLMVLLLGEGKSLYIRLKNSVFSV